MVGRGAVGEDVGWHHGPMPVDFRRCDPAVPPDATTPTWPMYLSAGYREVADYNANPHATVWGEKDL
jgi:hypothetical protein